MFRLGVLTISDKGSRGEREDLSGKVIQELLPPPEYETAHYEIVPDEQDQIAATLIRWSDQDNLDLIVTTGGTGLAPRDVTPEAMQRVVQRWVPGIAEAMRRESEKVTPMAMLSRATAGIRGRTLIINLPGSPKGVRECLAVVKPVIPHGLGLLRGEIKEHAPETRR